MFKSQKPVYGIYSKILLPCFFVILLDGDFYISTVIDITIVGEGPRCLQSHPTDRYIYSLCAPMVTT